ncbi:MAG: DUF523 and DUF1722 domain-containing protein [Alcanivoracaceae bacterium]|nr:DUF523 and DUF1722 domain-containing protein [Alcanivoracaceae bacterium]
MGQISVGISACLTGREVRHDGGHKNSRYCMDVLAEHFDFQPFCPEMGAGLGVPRPAMHLMDDGNTIRLVNVRGEGDHTDAMHGWITENVPAMDGLRGFILMAKSPSCGMERVRVYNADGEVLHREGSGLFASALQQAWPLLPVEEEGRLNDDALRENFMERVFFYDDWCALLAQGLSASGLLEFHTRHKFQLLAHDQAAYRALGPLLADLKAAPLEQIADTYIRGAMQGMRRLVSRGAHVNTLQHLFGFYRDDLSDAERAEANDQLQAYQRGEVPLVVPMTLLRMFQRRFPSDYVGSQHYLSPYPDRLGLRNRV